jgi:hypothetical protein
LETLCIQLFSLPQLSVYISYNAINTLCLKMIHTLIWHLCWYEFIIKMYIILFWFIIYLNFLSTLHLTLWVPSPKSINLSVPLSM